MGARIRLTKAIIDKAKPAPDRDTTIWDTEVPRFGVRVKSAADGAAKTFVAQYKLGGRSRRLALGRVGQLTLEQARALAREAFGQVARGVDPLEQRRAQRTGETVRELGARYLEQHARPKKKASSVRMDAANLEHHVYPRLGSKLVRDVTREQISRLHHEMRETPGAANRVLALLSKMFSLAEAWGLRPDGTNPVRHVERYRERKLERFLSEAELAALGTALEAAERDQTEFPEVVAALRLLALSGARRGEILNLRWEHVDFERRCLRLRDSKTGRKTIALNAPAVAVLEGLRREREEAAERAARARAPKIALAANARAASEFVLPGRRRNKPLAELARPWDRIRKAAGLGDVRIHDLRHSFASVGAGAGQSLLVIGKLLGHSNAATTQRYAHLSDDPVQQATEAIGARIAAAMARRPEAEVVELVP